MTPTNRGASRGFTMVELVLVMLIAGVLAAVAVPRVVDRGAFQSRGGAAEVRAALRYAQKLAMAKNREVCVTIAVNGLTLRFNPTLTPGAACSQNVVRPDGGGNYAVTLPAGINLTPATTFRFDSAGRPVPNAALALAVGGSVAVTVARETGYVQ